MVKQAPHLTRQFDFYKHIYKKIIQAATNRWVIPLPDMTVQLVLSFTSTGEDSDVMITQHYVPYNRRTKIPIILPAKDILGAQ